MTGRVRESFMSDVDDVESKVDELLIRAKTPEEISYLGKFVESWERRVDECALALDDTQAGGA